MKTSTKKFFAVLLSLIMAVTVCLPAFAESYDSLPDFVYFGGVATNESGYWLTDSNGKAVPGTAENYNIAYEAETSRITLKDAKLVSTDFEKYGSHDIFRSCGIATSGDTEIFLEGENEIRVVSDTRTVKEETAAIQILKGNLVIYGGGELSIKIENKADCCGIFSENGSLHISSTSVSISGKGKASRKVTVAGIEAPEVLIEDSYFNVDFEDIYYAFGILDEPENCTAKLFDSDVEMNFKGCAVSYGFNIYAVLIDSSNVNIAQSGGSNTTCGIFAYGFICLNSYVDTVITDSTGSGSAIAYNNALINNDRNNQIYTGSMSAKITPDSVSYSAVYINSGNSIFNPYENIYGGYFKTVNGSVTFGTKNNWNIHYDRMTNTLTLKDAEFAMPLRIIGCVNIVLEGENKIDCAQAPALQCDINQKFSGSGSLTLICSDYFAINCKATPVFGDGVTVTASYEADGSNSVEYNPLDATNYKWLHIQGNDKPDEGEKELTFWQKIVEFFKNIFNTLFGWIG